MVPRSLKRLCGSGLRVSDNGFHCPVLIFPLLILEPLKLTEEYRQKYISNTFSTRSMTKTGKPCLYWDSAEVQNISSAPSFSDNYCRVFDRSTPYLYCYFVTSDGEILREDCDHMPFYYDGKQLFSGMPLPNNLRVEQP